MFANDPKYEMDHSLEDEKVRYGGRLGYVNYCPKAEEWYRDPDDHVDPENSGRVEQISFGIGLENIPVHEPVKAAWEDIFIHLVEYVERGGYQQGE